MTVKPTTAVSQSTGTVITAAIWDNDVQASQNYLFELVSGANSDKIPSSALDPAGTPTFAVITLSNGGANQVSLQSSGFGTVALRNVSGVLTIYSSSGGNITLDASNKLNAAAASFSGAVATGALTVTGNAAISGTVQVQGGASIYSGSGAPAFSATAGSIYLNTAGGVYANTTGSTTWNRIAGT